MNVRKTLIAAAIAALLPLGASAVAGDKDKSMGDKSARTSSSFKKLDTNRDGRLSQTEAQMDASIVWSSADANADGYVDSEEWMAIPSEPGTTEPKTPRQY